MKLLIKEKEFILDNYFDAYLNALSDIYENENYTRIITSIFDHWLNEEESAEKIILYSEDDFKQNPDNLKLFNIYESRYLKYYEELYDSYKLYTAMYDIHDRICIFEYDSKDEFLEHMKLGFREELFFALLIPELDIIIRDEFDYKHVVFVKKHEKSSLYLDRIRSHLSNNGLFVLP